ncbi:MAG: hypothetical protein WB580_14930 [Candidatus Binataceae bacterium]
MAAKARLARHPGSVVTPRSGVEAQPLLVFQIQGAPFLMCCQGNLFYPLSRSIGPRPPRKPAIIIAGVRKAGDHEEGTNGKIVTIRVLARVLREARNMKVQSGLGQQR